jgi:hypothetical protein
MISGYIYKIQFPNGKHYIGLTTTSLDERTRQHKGRAKSGDTKYLYNAIRKYNMIDTLELIKIDTADTFHELCEKEIRYIIDYNSYYMNGNGYNMTYGGEGTNGYVYTEEARDQQSERMKEYYKNNPEAGKEHSERMINHYNENPEEREKQGERMKTILENPEIREKMRESQQKRWENQEAREQMSEAKISYYVENPDAGKEHSKRMIDHYKDQEAIEKNRKAQLKYHEEHPDARERMSEIANNYWSNQEARDQQSERRINYFQNTPDARQKNSESQKKRFKDPLERKRMSEIKIEQYKNDPEARRKSSKGPHKPFDVFRIVDKELIFIKTFEYQFEAIEYLQKEYNITTTIKISTVLAGNRKSSAGFVFTYSHN